MTDDGSHDRLEERLEKLEARVRHIEQLLREREDEASDEVVVERDSPEYAESREEPAVESQFDRLTLKESWLNWIGIGLLLLGVVFLFKYSIEQGWLIPPVRSAFGMAVGLALFAFGIEMDNRRTATRQLLLGGGIAAFYITGFATFQLYSFASYSAVWAFMVVVTLLALSLSLRQNQPILSILGTIGGLGTPFMLYRGEGSLTYLVAYTCLVLTGAGVIYFYKGWKSLLWTTAVGGWLVFLVGWISRIYDSAQPVFSDQWALQGGLLFAMVVLWAIPAFRVLSARGMVTVRFMPSEDSEEKSGMAEAVLPTDPNVQAVTVMVPVVTLFMSYGIWSLQQELWGLIALIGALFYGTFYLPLKRRNIGRLALAHGFAALILATVGLFLMLEGDILFIALVLEALALRVIAAKTGNYAISVFSHIVFGVVGAWLLDRLMAGAEVAGPVLVNLDAITQLFVIGVIGLAAPGYLKRSAASLTYRLSAHLAMLGWLLKELVILGDGQAYVSVAWGLYAILIISIGFFKDNNRLRLIGMGTVFLVVGKLFLVDLAQIQAIFRIFLFIGFGAVFLALGYYLQTHWPAEEPE